LLQRIRSGDADGWRRVVDLYAPLVFHWCRRWGVHGPDAEDVAQEVFAAAAQSIQQFQRERTGDTFRGWLRGITRHKVGEFWRRHGRQPKALGGSDAYHHLQEIPEPDADSGENAEEADQLSALFHRALEQIRGGFEQRTWQAFWRVTVDGQATADVAGELGMSVNGVRVAKWRVLSRLRTELGDLTQ
jgi:RNA polymerase sigma-70 factor, ECF subfamily